MRAPILIAASIAGLAAGAAAARAADLSLESSGYGCCYVEYGVPPLVVLDDEPGVVIRRWWLPPWRNRHFYPSGNTARTKVVTGKHVARRQPPRVPSYARYWTNPPVYLLDSPPLITRDEPLPLPRRYPPPAAAGR